MRRPAPLTLFRWHCFAVLFGTAVFSLISSHCDNWPVRVVCLAGTMLLPWTIVPMWRYTLKRINFERAVNETIKILKRPR